MARTLTLAALAAASLLALTSAMGQPRGGMPAPGGRGVQIQDCSYWVQRIEEAQSCAAKNRINAKKTSSAQSFSKLYGDAARACDAAIPKYRVELAKCRAQQRGGPGGGPNGGPGGGPGQPDPNEQLQQTLQQLAQLGRGQTQNAIGGILSSTQGLKGYGGAGVVHVSPNGVRIMGILSTVWTDDQLADLVDHWGLNYGWYTDAELSELREIGVGSYSGDGVPAWELDEFETKRSKVNIPGWCRQRADQLTLDGYDGCDRRLLLDQRQHQQMLDQGRSPRPGNLPSDKWARCNERARWRSERWKGCCKASARVDIHANGAQEILLGGCYW